jgi:hypothetical protein
MIAVRKGRDHFGRVGKERRYPGRAGHAHPVPALRLDSCRRNRAAQRVNSGGRSSSRLSDERADSPELRATFDAGDFWDSGDTQEFVGATSTAQAEPTGGTRNRGWRPRGLGGSVLRPRFIGGAVAATVIAFAALEAVGLVSANRPIEKSSVVSNRLESTAGRASEYASAPNVASIDALLAERLRLRQSVSAVRQSHRATRLTHRSATRSRPTTSESRVVPVSY